VHVNGDLAVQAHAALTGGPAHPMEVSYLHASPGDGH
jgi:hypothetical protein